MPSKNVLILHTLLYISSILSTKFFLPNMRKYYNHIIHFYHLFSSIDFIWLFPWHMFIQPIYCTRNSGHHAPFFLAPAECFGSPLVSQWWALATITVTQKHFFMLRAIYGTQFFMIQTFSDTNFTHIFMNACMKMAIVHACMLGFCWAFYMKCR